MQTTIANSDGQATKNSPGVKRGWSVAMASDRFDDPGKMACAASRIKMSERQPDGLISKDRKASQTISLATPSIEKLDSRNDANCQRDPSQKEYQEPTLVMVSFFVVPPRLGRSGGPD